MGVQEWYGRLPKGDTMMIVTEAETEAEARANIAKEHANPNPMSKYLLEKWAQNGAPLESWSSRRLKELQQDRDTLIGELGKVNHEYVELGGKLGDMEMVSAAVILYMYAVSISPSEHITTFENQLGRKLNSFELSILEGSWNSLEGRRPWLEVLKSMKHRRVE